MGVFLCILDHQSNAFRALVHFMVAQAGGIKTKIGKGVYIYRTVLSGDKRSLVAKIAGIKNQDILL